MSHRYLKDPHWYCAIFIAFVFWLAFHYLVQPASPRNLFETPEILLISILLYPILEEIVFRGLIQRQLILRSRWRARFWGVSGANVLTSLLFAGLHFVHQSPAMAALVIFPSLVFGYFRDRHHNVFPSIWLHIFYNGGFLYLFS